MLKVLSELVMYLNLWKVKDKLEDLDDCLYLHLLPFFIINKPHIMCQWDETRILGLKPWSYIFRSISVAHQIIL